MGNLVFQATLGGQVNLVGPNTASTFNLNVPAVSSTLATLTGTETFTNKTLTSPTLTTPVLGTPASGTLTNCTGLPNAGLVNSSVTVGSTAIALGATATTVAGLTSLATNTLTSASATALTLQSAGTTAVTIDTSQNVGIGTTSPTTLVDLAKSNTSGNDNQMPNLFVRNTSATQGNGSSTFNQAIAGVSAGNGTVSGGIRAAYDSAGSYGTGVQLYVNSTNPLQFYTNGSERMRIDSSGNLLVGTTSAGSGATSALLRVSKTSGNGIYSEAATTSAGYRYISNALSDGGTYYHFNFQENATQRGSITSNGSITLYNTTSDQRLKENIVDAGSGLEKLSNVKIRAFDWIDNKIHSDFGVIAQELQTVAPEAVSKGCTEDDMMSVDTSVLVPAMIKAIQELKAINDTQAETINALTARIVALEAK